MDPNKTLADALTIAERVMKNDSLGDDAELAARLLDLDEWIRKGGCMPSRWRLLADGSAFNGRRQ